MDSKGVSRRDFLKGSALTAIGVAAGGLLGGCGKNSDISASGQAEKAKLNFEKIPSSIPSASIKERITADVVVVGAGISGVIAALSAQQAGANTVVLQKGPCILTHGTAFGAIDTKLQKAAGVKINSVDAISEFQYQCANKPNFELLRTWAQHSGETLDWINEITAAQGGIGKFDATGSTDQGKKYWFNSFPTAHVWKGKVIGVATMIGKAAVHAGVQFYYKTPAVQLIREKNGRVTGVVAKTETGEYKQFNAAKGVILCTGDYGSNPEMVEKYCPAAVGYQNYYTPRYNTGDGHRMGMWVGAAMEDAPHCKMTHVHSTPQPGVGGDISGRAYPWLAVNHNGKRFINEDMPYAIMGNQVLRQPGGDGYFYQIIDADWSSNPKQFSPRTAAAPLPEKAFEQGIKDGLIFKANTLEELARVIKAPAENLKATVKRYNELVDKGVDEDYGKLSCDLTPVKKAPFYAIPRLCCLSVTLGGLVINTKMQVLDKEKKVIPGLYAAGNASGDFFSGANDYPFALVAVSVGRAATFGRLAGQNAAVDKA